MQIKRFLQLMVAVAASNVFTIGLANAEIEPVVVVGKKCGDMTCGTGPFSDQQTDYDPFGIPVGKAGGTITDKVQKVVEAIKADPPCKANNESCSIYTTRAFGICLDRVLAATVSTGYTLAAATQACSPFKADAATACATDTVATCGAT